jgi:hypothetical protein
LTRAVKATVQRILAEQPLHPERVRYYLEKRDPAFEVGMRDVLLVYQEVALQNQAQSSGEGRPAVITISVDEKPGLQAIANTTPDLPPVPGKHPNVGRDHEYKRLWGEVCLRETQCSWNFLCRRAPIFIRLPIAVSK